MGITVDNLAGDPAFGLVVTVVLTIVATGLVLRIKTGRTAPSDPLSNLFTAERFEAEIEACERRVSPFAGRSAMLRARIEPIGDVRRQFNPESRAEALAQVAQVMRAGVRKGDIVIEAEGPEGDGSFVIVAQGASEEDAGSIAHRLLRSLSGTRFTASFGIAARRDRESEAAWHARARQALDATGSSRVVTASEWEEIALLPAPVPSSQSEAA